MMNKAHIKPARTVSVLLPLALAEPYDYLVPDGMEVAPGDYVTAPLGSRQLVGVVWGEGSGEVQAARLKSLVERHDMPPMPEVLRRFVSWVSAYTLTPAGSVLRLTSRAGGIFEPPKTRRLYRLADAGRADQLKMTPARERVMKVASDGAARSLADLAQEAGVSTGVLKGLTEAGLLEAVRVSGEAPLPEPDLTRKGFSLSEQQQEAASLLCRHVAEDSFSTLVLDGVTGSGKTEVYFEAVAEALRHGRQVLILLPEIALTNQFLARFEQRFGCRPAEWHSDLTGSERRRVWRAVSEGRAPVVVGARSALFLPFTRLGLIVVDEEHDAAFKQEEGVIYHARDMAVVRASLGGFPIILSSATPSLETVINVDLGKYHAVRLEVRHGEARLPEISTIDMRMYPPERGNWLSPVLINGMVERMAAGEQSMLFLNRRGYAPLTLCRSCGHRIECPQCSAWLVEHRFRQELVCHHCDYHAPVPKHCPSCQAEDSLVACGPGVERIAEEVTRLFPQARVAVVSSDNLNGPAAHESIFAAMEKRELDIVIGTQIISKGHHFPWLTLVGVVDADLGLENGDLRAGERTFQLLQQVAGRAGRAERPGRVLLQSYMPEHSVMQALISGRRDEFLKKEAYARERLSMPPYGRLAGVIISSVNGDLARNVAREMARRAPIADNVSVLGPAPAPLALLRGRTRLRFLVKTGKNVNLQAYMKAWLGSVKLPNAVRVAVDIDPYSFL